MPSTPLETTTPYMYLLPLTGSWSYFWSVDLFDLLVIWVGRDEYCPDTLASLYKQASHPDKIFIGLVQQNCYEHCRSGVLEGLKVVDVGPDPDCKQLFCDTEVTNQLSLFYLIISLSLESLFVPEIRSDSSTSTRVSHWDLTWEGFKSLLVLFDVFRFERYFGAKLFLGESFYLQIDSHSYFAPHWDQVLVWVDYDFWVNSLWWTWRRTLPQRSLSFQVWDQTKFMITSLSGYPPPHDFKNWENGVGYRMCDAQVWFFISISSHIISFLPCFQ